MRRTHRGVMNDVSLDPSAFLLLEFLVDDHRRHLVSLLIPQFSPSCSQGSRSQGTYLCRAPDKVFCLDSEGLSQAQRKPAATGFRQPPLPLCTSLTPSADTPSKFLLFLRPADDLTRLETPNEHSGPRTGAGVGCCQQLAGREMGLFGVPARCRCWEDSSECLDDSPGFVTTNTTCQKANKTVSQRPNSRIAGTLGRACCPVPWLPAILIKLSRSV